MKKSYIVVFSLMLVLVLFSTAVSAQEKGTITQTFKDIFGMFAGFDLKEIYLSSAGIIDSIVFFIIFLSLAQLTLGKRFEGPPGKAMSVAVAIALTIGAYFFFTARGWNLGSLAPLAGFFVVIIFAIMAYTFFRSLNMGVTAAAVVVYLAVYFILISVFSVFFEETLKQKAPMVMSLLTLGAAVAFIIAIVEIFKFFGHLGGKGGGEGILGGISPFKRAGPPEMPGPERRPPTAPKEEEEMTYAPFKRGEKGIEEIAEKEEDVLKDMESLEGVEIKENEDIVNQVKAVIGVINKYLVIPAAKFYLYIPNMRVHIPRLIQYLQGVLKENERIEMQIHELEKEAKAIEAEVNEQLDKRRREALKMGTTFETEKEKWLIRRERKLARVLMRYDKKDENLMRKMLEHSDNFKKYLREAINELQSGASQTLAARASKASFTIFHTYAKKAIKALDNAIREKNEEIRILKKLVKVEHKEERKVRGGERARKRTVKKTGREARAGKGKLVKR